MSRTSVWSLCLLFCFSVMANANATVSPTDRVRQAVDGIVEVLRDGKLAREQRWERIGTIIRERFDIEAMSQSVLATNWKKATPEEKRDFIEFFSQYLENTYRKKIEGYTDEEIVFHDEIVKGERASVETSVVTDTAQIPVVYKMRQNEGEWFAYDVVVEGVSLVRNYRDTFAAIVRSEGMDGLLLNLQGSINQYKSEQADD